MDRVFTVDCKECIEVCDCSSVCVDYNRDNTEKGGGGR